jgi:hypothetical protein
VGGDNLKGARVIKPFWIILLLVLLNAYFATANVLYVDCNSPNDPGSGTSDDPFRTIQYGINTAIAGDTVQINPGIYTGVGNYDIDPCGKSITIQSINPEDAGVVANTIIDPEKNGRGFYIHNHEDANCVISGLTIRNAYTVTDYDGAGVYCLNSNATIKNCIIQDGHATGSGGGICTFSNLTITNCIIKGNTADYYGGGISCVYSEPNIIGCTIMNNTSGLEGGGIDSGGSNPNIYNCLITNNNSRLGSGINCYFPGVAQIVNCTLVANRADDTGGAVYCWRNGSAIIENSILWANSAVNGSELGLFEGGYASFAYCDVQDGQAGVYDPCGLLSWSNDNIDTDPCFGTFNPNGDPNLWDFHLKSVYGRWNSTFYRIDLNKDGIINLIDFARIANLWMQQSNLPEDLDNSGIVDWTDMELFAQYYLTNSIEDGWIIDSSTSPCIDAGDPNSDWTAEPWPNGKRINMGAYGGTTQASKNGNIADFDINGNVDFIDFALFAEQWNQGAGTIEDINRDGILDVFDLFIFADNWLWSRQ